MRDALENIWALLSSWLFGITSMISPLRQRRAFSTVVTIAIVVGIIAAGLIVVVLLVYPSSSSSTTTIYT